MTIVLLYTLNIYPTLAALSIQCVCVKLCTLYCTHALYNEFAVYKELSVHSSGSNDETEMYFLSVVIRNTA